MITIKTGSRPALNLHESYLETIRLSERLHRQFLEVVRTELDRLNVSDINNVQALILFNIAREEMTVGELTSRGYYYGSNVSYNLRKMVESGYIVQQRSERDRRLVRIRLTTKGVELWDRLDQMFDRQVSQLSETTAGELGSANETWRRLERFWIAQASLQMRPAELQTANEP